MLLAAARVLPDEDLAPLLTTWATGDQDVAIIRKVVNAVPDWCIELEEPHQHLAQDHLRILSLLVGGAHTDEMTYRRLELILGAAMRELDEGALGRVAIVLGKTDELIEATSLSDEARTEMRDTGLRYLQRPRLEALLKSNRRGCQLRQIFHFFPSLRPRELLSRLANEPDRKERRFLIEMLLAHGSNTRTEVLGILERQNAPGAKRLRWYVRRNLVHLLRRLDHEAADLARLEEELEAVLEATKPGKAVQIVKEGLLYLSESGDPGAEHHLVDRLTALREWEEFRKKKKATKSGKLIDVGALRVVALHRLLRRGAPLNREEALSHLLESEWRRDLHPLLEELGNEDLTHASGLRNQLIEAVRARFPSSGLRRFAAVSFRLDGPRIKAILGALRSTTHPEVEQLFREVEEHARTARVRGLAERVQELRGLRASLSTSAKPESDLPSPASADSINASEDQEERRGMVDVLGLSALLQDFASRSATGLVALLDQENRELGKLGFRDGIPVSCRAGSLRNDSAFYALLQCGRVTRYRFVPNVARCDSTWQAPPVLRLSVEGLRRVEELDSLRYLLPDDVRLHAIVEQPSPPCEPVDGLVLRRCWKLLQGGASAEELDGELEAEPCVVRRLLRFWSDQGDIRPRSRPKTGRVRGALTARGA